MSGHLFVRGSVFIRVKSDCRRFVALLSVTTGPAAQWGMLQWRGEICYSEVAKYAAVKWRNMLQRSGEICCSEVVKYATMKWWNMLQWSGEICYSEVVKYASKWWNMLQWSGEICCSEVVKYATVKWWNMLMSCMETTCNVGFIYRAFHNVLCYYKHL